MKILVCGGRDYQEYERLKRVLWWLPEYSYVEREITSIVHGAAPGADSLAERYAQEHGIKSYPTPADWNKHGRAAGPIRNAQMLADHPDIQMVVAFPGGRGTQNMIDKAKAKGIYVVQIMR